MIIMIILICRPYYNSLISLNPCLSFPRKLAFILKNFPTSKLLKWIGGNRNAWVISPFIALPLSIGVAENYIIIAIARYGVVGFLIITSAKKYIILVTPDTMIHY